MNEFVFILYPSAFLHVPRRGIEPRPAVSKTAMLPAHSQGIDRLKNGDWLRRWTNNFSSSAYEPVPVPLFQHQRADDWVRTSMNQLTRLAPFSFEPRRLFSRSIQQAPAQGVEPCRAVLEAACSPGSTPV